MHKTLYWLTKDLRIDDNAALIAAAKSDSLLCVYCIEPRWFSQYRYHTASMGAHRWQFIRRCLSDLRVALASYGQEILFVVGEPDRCLAELVERHAIDSGSRRRRRSHAQDGPLACAALVVAEPGMRPLQLTEGIKRVGCEVLFALSRREDRKDELIAAWRRVEPGDARLH